MNYLKKFNEGYVTDLNQSIKDLVTSHRKDIDDCLQVIIDEYDLEFIEFKASVRNNNAIDLYFFYASSRKIYIDANFIKDVEMSNRKLSAIGLIANVGFSGRYDLFAQKKAYFKNTGIIKEESFMTLGISI